MLKALGGGGIGSFVASSNYYAADHPLIAYTDCVAPTIVGGFARFQRPYDDGGSYMNAMPGARQRFRSDAPAVNVTLRFNGLIARTDARNMIGAIFIDGAFVRNFQSPAPVNTVVTQTLTITSGTSVDRLYEIVLPYADGVEFGGVEVGLPYVVTAAAARAGRLMVCHGDSITHGFQASEVRKTWPFLLADIKVFRCINMVYGGRVTVPSDGTAIGNLHPDLVTVLIGTNDYLGQTPLATYQANLQALIVNIHNVNPTVPIYMSGITLTTASYPIPLSSYQNVAGAVIAALGYPQLHGVNTLTLINSSSQLVDGVHPSDAGSAFMANGWASVIT